MIWKPNHLRLLGALGLLMALTSGCAMSSSQRWELASTTYATALAVVTVASLSGNITASQMEEFEVIRIEAAEMLVEWSEALDRGEEYGNVAQLQALLSHLIAIQLGVQDDGNPGSTSLDPSPRQHKDWPYYVDPDGYLRAA